MTQTDDELKQFRFQYESDVSQVLWILIKLNELQSQFLWIAYLSHSV